MVFLHVASVPGMGGRLVTLMGQLGVGRGGGVRGPRGWRQGRSQKLS